MEKHLKNRQHYVDLYDLHTVEICRRLDTPSETGVKDKKLSKRQLAILEKGAMELIIHFQAGERYLKKESTILEWEQRDKARDELYESAEAPEGIRCLTCRSLVKPTFKDLWSHLDTEDRVLFMYDCPNNCLPRRAFFSDGKEYRTKPNLCPKCNTTLNYKDVSNKEKFITKYTCVNTKCKYTKTDKIIRNANLEEEIDEDFSKDRDRFCITEEEGKKYQDEKWNMEQAGKFMEEWKKKDDAQKKKLEENPGGFHLEGVGYSCVICGQNTPEGDNWYDKYGIKCLICQKAVDDGKIPASIAKNKDSWYSKYDIENRFNIKGPTFYSWIRKGVIKPRTIKNFNKGDHVQIFMVKDNTDTLPPKELTKSRSVKEEKDGKTYYGSEPWYKFTDAIEKVKDYKIMDYLKIVEEKPEVEK